MNLHRLPINLRVSVMWQFVCILWAIVHGSTGYKKECDNSGCHVKKVPVSSPIDVSHRIRKQLENLGGSYTRPTNGFPWPMPQKFTSGGSNLTIAPDQFKFLSTYQCDILSQAMDRYKVIIFANKPDPPPTWPISPTDDVPSFTVLNIEVDAPCEKYPQDNMNENYTLSVWANGTGLLKAPAIWGALRGLETFSQLVFSPDHQHWYITSAQIIDYPRFSFRGILLDTSRHFITVPTLLKNLDLMQHNKFNVFHWHIVDDQSFPYVSELFPDLSTKGAYSPKHIYTQKDIKTIIEYARIRGIRVLPEFDTPGHTLSWGSQPDLLTSCYDKSGKPDGTFGPIDPSNDKNFDFLTALFREVLELFPDNYIHLGGDEVPFDCWSTNPKILEFMKLQGFGNDFSRLEQYYIENLLWLIRRARNGTGYLVWQEVVDNGVQVKPDTVVHVWKGNTDAEWGAEMDRVTMKKLRTVLSSCWYLNYISYGTDWPKYYACDPHSFIGTQAQKDLVIGGEACMWGEYVDGTNVIPYLWPRASAVAERLWSSADVVDPEAAAPRLEEHRCRLLRRGYQVPSVNGPGYCLSEWTD